MGDVQISPHDPSSVLGSSGHLPRKPCSHGFLPSSEAEPPLHTTASQASTQPLLLLMPTFTKCWGRERWTKAKHKSRLHTERHGWQIKDGRQVFDILPMDRWGLCPLPSHMSGTTTALTNRTWWMQCCQILTQGCHLPLPDSWTSCTWSLSRQARQATAL